MGEMSSFIIDMGMWEGLSQATKLGTGSLGAIGANLEQGFAEKAITAGAKQMGISTELFGAVGRSPSAINYAETVMGNTPGWSGKNATKHADKFVKKKFRNMQSKFLKAGDEALLKSQGAKKFQQTIMSRMESSTLKLGQKEMGAATAALVDSVAAGGTKGIMMAKLGSMASVAMTAMNVYMAVTMPFEIGQMIGQGAQAIIAKKKGARHGGRVLQTKESFTMRQAAMQKMVSNTYSTSPFIGEEAKILHA